MRILIKLSTYILLIYCILNFNPCYSQCELKAGALFEQGRFQDLANEYKNCKNKDQLEEYELIFVSRAYIELKDIEEAKVIIGLIFDQNPDYIIRESDGTLLYRALAEQVKNERSSNMIYSVSKSAENPDEAPATVIVITAKQIKDRGYYNLEELLHDLPGFDISTGRGPAFSNMYQRGYRSNQTDHTLMLVDGVEMNDLSSHNAFISRQYPMSNIKQIEIIYGPISNIYGANAFSGVINIITYKGDDFLTDDAKFGIATSASTGTYNTHTFDFSAGLNTKHFSFISSGRYFTSDEMDLSSYDNWNYGLDSRYEENLMTTDSILIVDIIETGATDYYTSSIDGKTLFPTSFAISEAKSFDPENPYSNTSENFSINNILKISNFTFGFHTWKKKEGNVGWYNWKHMGSENGNNWIINNTSSFLHYNAKIGKPENPFEITFFTRFKAHKVNQQTRFVTIPRSFQGGEFNLLNLINWDPATNTIPIDTLNFYRVSKQLRSEIRINHELPLGANQALAIMFGTEVRNSQIQGDYTNSKTGTIKSEIDSSITKPGNFFSYVEAGVFTEATVKTKSPWKFTIGGRYDYSKPGLAGKRIDVFNLRSALMYISDLRENDKLILKAIYSTAFKDASPFNRYSETDDRIPNPKLEPERIKNAEFNAIYKLGSYKFSVAAYHSWISNVIRLEPTDNSKTQNQNAGDSEVTGIEFFTQAQIYDKFHFYLNYTFLDPRIMLEKKDKSDSVRVRVGDMAKHHFNFGLNKEFKINDHSVNLNFRGNLVGEKPTGKGTSVGTNSLTHINPYTVYHAVVSYTTPESAHRLSVQLIVNNIFNANYYHPGVRLAGNGNYAASLPQNRRNIHLKLIYGFKTR